MDETPLSLDRLIQNPDELSFKLNPFALEVVGGVELGSGQDFQAKLGELPGGTRGESGQWMAGERDLDLALRNSLTLMPRSQSRWELLRCMLR